MSGDRGPASKNLLGLPVAFSVPSVPVNPVIGLHRIRDAKCPAVFRFISSYPGSELATKNTTGPETG